MDNSVDKKRAFKSQKGQKKGKKGAEGFLKIVPYKTRVGDIYNKKFFRGVPPSSLKKKHKQIIVQNKYPTPHHSIYTTPPTKKQMRVYRVDTPGVSKKDGCCILSVICSTDKPTCGDAQ